MVEYSLWGKNVDIEIPKDKFPTQQEIEDLDSKMPDCEHGWFESVAKAQLHYRIMLPSAQPPKGIVVFCHGIAANGGKAFILKDGSRLNVSYLQERLLERGYALYTLDLLGHGFSEGSRFFVPSWQENRDDLVAFANHVASKHDDGTPLFLMGESYGSCLSLHAAKVFQDDPSKGPSGFKGIAVMAPAVVANLPPAVVVFVLRYMFAPFFPKWVPFFMPNTVSPDRLWRNPEVAELNMDPKYQSWGLAASGQPFKLGTGLNLLLAVEDVRERVVPELTVPFCAVHGTEDYAVLPASTDYLEEHAKTPEEDRAILRLEGSYHDLLGDPLRVEAMDFILRFLESRTTK